MKDLLDLVPDLRTVSLLTWGTPSSWGPLEGATGLPHTKARVAMSALVNLSKFMRTGSTQFKVEVKLSWTAYTSR